MKEQDTCIGKTTQTVIVHFSFLCMNKFTHHLQSPVTLRQ